VDSRSFELIFSLPGTEVGGYYSRACATRRLADIVAGRSVVSRLPERSSHQREGRDASLGSLVQTDSVKFLFRVPENDSGFSHAVHFARRYVQVCP
jgi:hypothetical protein